MLEVLEIIGWVVLSFIGFCFLVAFGAAIHLNVKHRMEDERAAARKFAEQAMNERKRPPWLN